MSVAVGTSLLVIGLKSFAGLGGYLASVQIDWGLAAAVTDAALLGSVLGGTLTGRIAPDTLRRGFGWFVVVMGVYVLAQLASAVLGNPPVGSLGIAAAAGVLTVAVALLPRKGGSRRRQVNHQAADLLTSGDKPMTPAPGTTGTTGTTNTTDAGVDPVVVVVGGGHNGLVAACYLAKAGRRVLVLEASDKLGGGSRTDETIPGYRFNTHSAAHNIINMTSIPEELDLAGAGLEYLPMEPFATGMFADGRVVRFHRDIDATVASIAEHDPADAEAYRRLMHRAVPLVKTVVAALEGGSSVAGAARAAGSKGFSLLQALRRSGAVGLAHDLVTPYGSLLQTALRSDLTRAPVSSFASHSSAGPHLPGGAFYVFWQAAYHLYGQWHARGGSQSLTDALERRLTGWGGQVRTDAVVERIDARGGRARSVTLTGGERIDAAAVITAVDVQTALLQLLDPPLAGDAGRELAAAHRGNAVQMVVHLATDRLPQYRGAHEGDWNGLQSLVDDMDQLSRGFHDAEARRLPERPPTYCFTPSVYDDSLAPAGKHTVYLACPSTPYEVEGGWDQHAEAFTEKMIDQVEEHAPGFRSTILGRDIWTPARMSEQLRWPGAHPMYLDISLDQLSFLRPTRRLSNHRVPGVEGLYTCGASTAPVGGIAGTSGKAAARALLATKQ